MLNHSHLMRATEEPLSICKRIDPAFCFQVNAILSWAVEGIKEIYINGKGRMGHDSDVICNTDMQPTMRVLLLDGTERTFTLRVEKLYTNPVIIGLWIGVILGLSATAYSLFGISGAVFILTIILFWSITRISIETVSDYWIHLRYQQMVLDSGNLNVLPPHPLYYFLGVVVAGLFPDMPLSGANSVVVIMAYGVGSIATYWLLKVIVGESTCSKIRQALIYIPLALSLSCVVPLVVSGNPLHTLIGRPDIPMNMFTSPTLLVLRPFALFAFLGLVKWITVIPARPWIPVLAVGAAIVAATLAKPNYTMAIVPAVVLLLGWGFIRLLRLNRTLIIAGVVIPAIMVLGWQFLRVYGPNSTSAVYNAARTASIAFAPLELYLIHWRYPVPQVVVGFLLSSVFPIVVYLMYFKEAWRSLTLNLAWLVFLIGQSFAYLFIEIGYQSSGNLTWGGRIALFVLFAVSLGFLIRQNAGSLLNGGRLARDPRFYLCSAAYVLHLLPYLQYAHVNLT